MAEQRISQATIDGEGQMPDHYYKETAPIIDPAAPTQEAASDEADDGDQKGLADDGKDTDPSGQPTGETVTGDTDPKPLP